MMGEPERRQQVVVDRFLEYLYSTRWQLFSYHNQKEAFGWGAVALFVGASSLFLSRREPSLTGQILTSVALTFALLVTSAFARRQFVLREYAARNVRAFERMILLVIAGESEIEMDLEAQLRPQDLPSQKPPRGKFRLYPPRLADNDFANQSNRPPLVVRLLEEYGEKMDDPRPGELEIMAYLIMTATTVIGLVTVWT